MNNEQFILGVNYWPRRKAMYWWSDFDAGEVREEFAIIRGIGMSLVRIFLLWDDWQPEPDQVNPEALRNLGIVCDIAAELGLRLDVTFFTGHMSGPNWSPGWLLEKNRPIPPRVRRVMSGGKIVDCGYRNMYTDKTALNAAQLLLQTVVSAYKDHPAIGMWNLGNEPDLFAWPVSAESGRKWVQQMTSIIKEIDPDHPVTCGLHVDSLVRDNGLRVHDVFGETDVAVMHGYPMYAKGWSKGPLDSDFVPYLCALTTALCGKPTLMEEFGGCTTAPGTPSEVWGWVSYGKPRTQFMAGEEPFAAYIAEVLPKLQTVGATGAMLWCYADYVPELYDRPPCSADGAKHERFFGLVRPDGSLKPHARAIQAFAATQPMIQPAQRTVMMDISAEQYYEDAAHHAKRLYQTF